MEEIAAEAGNKTLNNDGADVEILDKNEPNIQNDKNDQTRGEVIALMKEVSQGSFCKSVAGAKTVIEFPVGSIEKYRIREGDDVRFE